MNKKRTSFFSAIIFAAFVLSGCCTAAYENEKYAEWGEDWDFRDPTVVEFEELPVRWKRALKYKDFVLDFEGN